jgi:hypothetical protein
MKRNAFMLLAGLLATGLIAAGCGDDDEDDDGGDEALTEQEFITQADQICREGDAEVESQEREFFGKDEPSQAEVEQYVSEVVAPGIQSQIDGIRELEAPEEIEGQVTEFLDTAEGGLDELEQNPGLLTEGGQGADPFAETRQLGADLGLKVCAQ